MSYVCVLRFHYPGETTDDCPVDKDGGCIGHCNVTEYDTFLSYASLPSKMDRHIGHDVRNKYHHALDIEERVEEASLSRTLNLMTVIGDQLSFLFNLITVNVESEGTSLFDRMDLCSEKFEKIVKADLGHVYEELQRDLDVSYSTKQKGQFIKKKNAETLERIHYLSWRLVDISLYMDYHENIGDLTSRLLETQSALTSFLNETVKAGRLVVDFDRHLSDTSGSYYTWNPPLSDFSKEHPNRYDSEKQEDAVRGNPACQTSRTNLGKALQNISDLFLHAEAKLSSFLSENLTTEGLHYLYSDRYGDNVLIEMLNKIDKWNLQVEDCTMGYITLLENSLAARRLVPEIYFNSVPFPDIQGELLVLEKDVKELSGLREQYGEEKLRKSRLVKLITAEKAETVLDHIQELLTQIDTKLIDPRETQYWAMADAITDDYFKVLTSAREVQRYNLTRYDDSRPYTELKLWQVPEPQLNSENPVQFDEKQSEHMWLDMTLDTFMDKGGRDTIMVGMSVLWCWRYCIIN